METTTTIDRLPNDVLRKIFEQLNLQSAISTALVCRRWMTILRSILTQLSDVSLTFEDGFCELRCEVQVDSNRQMKEAKRCNSEPSGLLRLNLCACPEHVKAHRLFLDVIFAEIADSLKRLTVEDYLLKPNCCVEMLVLPTMKLCGQLRSLELHHVDLRQFPRQSLGKVANQHLLELTLNQCLWNGWTTGVVNRFLITVAVMAPNLLQMRLIACPLISDNSLQILAAYCRRLWLAEFRDCRSVTADGLSFFFRSIENRQPDMTYLGVSKTGIDYNRLSYLLNEFDDGQWLASGFLTDTGQQALSFHKRASPTKSLVLFN